jgi:hypothetical protein
MIATKIESLKCRIIQLGSGLVINLYDVEFASELWVNLFSINKALKNDYHLRNQGL